MTAARLAGGAALLLVAGCAGTKLPAVPLGAAQTAFATASADPGAAQTAPTELRLARDELARALALQRAGGDPTDIGFYAYLAERHSRLATAAARLRTAETRIADASARRAERLHATGSGSSSPAMADPGPALSDLGREEAALEAGGGAARLTLGDALFLPDAATLRPEAAGALRRLAGFLARDGGRTVLVEGFAEPTANPAVSRGLSQARADAVAAVLAANGVDPARILARGLGPRGTAGNFDPAGQRRVLVVVSDAEGNLPADAIPSTGG